MPQNVWELLWMEDQCAARLCNLGRNETVLRMMRFEFGEDFSLQILGHSSFIRTIGTGWDAFYTVAKRVRQPCRSVEYP